MTDSEQDSSSTADKSEDLTESTQVRFAYLGSIVSAVIIVWFLGIVTLAVLGIASLEAMKLGTFGVVALLVLAAGTWVFGIDLIDKWAGGE